MDKRAVEQDVFALDILTQKTNVVVSDLRNTYFLESNPDKSMLAVLYADAELRSSIITDYLCEISDVIENIKRNLEEGVAGQGKKQTREQG